jgi:predicted RecA/RadA family phage recombinase
MKNFVQEGDVLTLTTPDGGVVSGGVYQVGQILAVATKTITDAEYDAGETTFEGKIEGVFTVTKAGSQAWAIGALVYWDDGAKNFTTTAAGNLLAGHAVVATGSDSGETTGVVRLDGAARDNEST